MRRFLTVAGFSLVLASSADASERVSGILTIGCGDVSLGIVKEGKQPAPMELLAVQLTPEQTEQVFVLAGIKKAKHRGVWRSLYVELDGQVSADAVTTAFGAYHQTLKVSNVHASRQLDVGESIRAYHDEVQTYTGYVIVGREVVAFLPLDHQGEPWWIVPHNEDVNAEIEGHFGKFDPNATVETQIARAQVEGWSGPPGTYGHMGGFIREVLISHLKIGAPASRDDLKAAGFANGTLPPLLMCKPTK